MRDKLYTTIRSNVLTTISRPGYADKYFNHDWQDLSAENAMNDHLVRENQLKEIIEKHVTILPNKMCKVFALSRNAQLTHKEIAAQLGISQNTSKSEINNALYLLMSKLGPAICILMGLNGH